MMALGSATWNATAKEVASSAHRLVSTVRDRATVVVIAAKLWQVHRAMGNMLEDFYSKVEHPVPLTEPLDEDKLRAGLSSLRNLSDAIGQIALGLRQKGLANRSYIAAPMNSLKVYSDQLLDIVEAAELMLDPSSYGAAEAKFAKSLEELRTGETVKLESIL